MNDFKLMVVSAGFISIIISLFENMFPTEKFSKQLKFIFAAIIISVIINPLVKHGIFKFDSTDLSVISTNKLVNNTDNTWDYFKESVENNISSNIGKEISNEEIFFYDIKTSINISDSGSISINEIEITVENTVQEAEIIDLVREIIGEDAVIKVVENDSDE